MTQTLALKYRPQSFEDMVGQKVTSAVLNRMVETNKVPTGLLFSGVRGSGKTSSARILANAMGVKDVIEIDAASHGSVADVRQLLETLRFSSGSVVILDEAQSLSREAFHALLKTLEEPPAGVTFILVTTEPEKILGTVKSRLMEFTFRKVSPALIQERLYKVIQAEGIAHSSGLVAYIAERADGSMRDALMMLDQCATAGITTKQEFLELAGEEDVAPDVLKALTTADHAYIFEVVEEVSQRVPDPAKLASMLVGAIRDVLILKSGGSVDASEEGTRKRKELALSIESDRLLASLKLLWDLRTKTKQSSDPRSNLDLALILVSEVLTRGKQASLRPAPKAEVAPTVTKSEPPRRLSLDEL